MANYMREKKYYCGEEYMEVDIYSYSNNQKRTVRGKRSKKKKESLQSQKNLNKKNSKRELTRLVENNFKKNDYHVSLTYTDEMMPKTLEDADREMKNFFARIRRRIKAEGGEELKYILINSYPVKIEEGKVIRMHHHIIMNNCLDRDTIEDLWRRRKRKGEEEGKPIGYVNVDRLQPDENTGLGAISAYLAEQITEDAEDVEGKRRWSPSQNLERVESRTNDFKYSRRQIRKLATESLDLEFWNKKYPGWKITDKDYGYEKVYNELTGWSIYLKLRKIKQ